MAKFSDFLEYVLYTSTIMLRLIYIIYALVGLVCAWLAVAFFGYAIVHGAIFLLLLFPLVLGIFILPVFLEKKLRMRTRLVYLVYLFPIVLVVLPSLYLFVLNPITQRIVATKALENIVVLPQGEELVYTNTGEPIGLKFFYTVVIPHDFPYDWKTNGGYAFFEFPTPVVGNREHPGFSMGLLELETVFATTSKGVLNVEQEKMLPGKYDAVAVFLAPFVEYENGFFCKSSFQNTEYIGYSLPEEDIFVSIISEVHLSNRMGIFSIPHLSQYPLASRFSGQDIKSTTTNLPVCTDEYR